MTPNQCIELHDWVSCSGGMPLGSNGQPSLGELDLEVLLECDMEQSQGSENNITPVRNIYCNNILYRYNISFNNV